MNKLKWIIFTFLFFIGACATKPVPPEASSGVSFKVPALDLDEVEAKLNMRSPRESLGFSERKFNACKLGLSDVHCRDQYFSSINFRVLCRDSTGTVEYVSNVELVPLVVHRLSWQLGLYRGRTKTDSDGYGRVRVLTPGSSRSQRFVLVHGKKSLGVEASEVSRIILPKDWCG